MSGLRVAVVHFTPDLGAVESNRARLVELCEEAAQAGARLVVLPELATSGFCMDASQAASWAEDRRGPTADALGEVSARRGLVVVAGIPLRAEGQLYNAQVVLDGGRVVGDYRKHHLFGADHDWARPGVSPGACVETTAGRVGLLICHDIVYPRTVLAVADARPRLVAFSTAWIGDGEGVPFHWVWAAQTLGSAPLLVANRGGREGEVLFDDPSAILGAAACCLGRRSPEAQVLVAEV